MNLTVVYPPPMPTTAISITGSNPVTVNYSFVCNTTLLVPANTTYTWNFGDDGIFTNTVGTKLVNSTVLPSSTATHQYVANGLFPAGCYATDGTNFAIGPTILVNVTSVVTPNWTTAINATVNVADGFPADANYVFWCNATGFTPTNYTWSFSDANTTVRNGTIRGIIANDIYRAYAANGTYNVTCTASDTLHSVTDTRAITVASEYFGFGATILHDPQTSDGNISFHLRPIGFSPLQSFGSYVVTGPDGFFVNNGPGAPINFTIMFPEPGLYNISGSVEGFDQKYLPRFYNDNPFEYHEDNACNSPGCYSGGFAMSINVANFSAPATGANMSVNLSIAPFYPQNNIYMFQCNSTGFTPSTYDWFFGDGQKLVGVTNQDLIHVFPAGTSYPVSYYNVTCVGHSNATIANSTITVSSPQPVAALVSIDPGFPKGLNYSFTCSTTGLDPSNTTMSWLLYTGFGNTNYTLQVTNARSINVSFPIPEQYVVECLANDPHTGAGNTIVVNATG
jgi:hypothetical protein